MRQGFGGDRSGDARRQSPFVLGGGSPLECGDLTPPFPAWLATLFFGVVAIQDWSQQSGTKPPKSAYEHMLVLVFVEI